MVTGLQSGVKLTLEGARQDLPEPLRVHIAQFAGEMAREAVVGCVDPSDGGIANTVTATIPATSCGESGNRAGASGAAMIDLVQFMTPLALF